MDLLSIVICLCTYMPTLMLIGLEIKMILPTSAFIIYLECNPGSWSTKKQRTVARFSTKAEYLSIIATTANLRWISNLLGELGYSSTQTPVIYCDNVGETNLCSNPVFN